jgi:hypothetical protein
MQRATSCRAILIVSLLFAMASTARAAEAMVEVPGPAPPPPALTKPPPRPPRWEILTELAPGLAVSLVNAPVLGSFAPSADIGGRVGMIVWMANRRYALVPELEIRGTPLVTDCSACGKTADRIAGLFGMRLVWPVARRIAVYGRLMMGADWLSENAVASGTGDLSGQTLYFAQTGFVLEPGAGAMLLIGRRFDLGLYAGLPVTPGAELVVRNRHGAIVQHETLTALNLRVLAMLGLRLF